MANRSENFFSANGQVGRKVATNKTRVCGWLCVFVCSFLALGCSAIKEQLKDGVSFQVPVYVWSNQYIVNQGALVAAGLACEWEPGTKSCKLIQAGDRYDIQAGKWTSAALVQVSGEDVVSVQSEIVPYDKDNDKCLTNPKLSKIECSPNFVVHVTGKPNDPLYEDALFKQHGARRWVSHPRPAGPIIAVIDTGVDYNHEDLSGKVVGCYNAITDTEGSCYDDNGHGSHCASIISSNRDNGVGISGICSNCGIFAVKFLSASGSGSLYHAIRAIDWAVAHGARVLSNSWGGGGYSEPLKQAIERARLKGILFIGAAGNNGASFANYPAMYPLDNVVAVAAVDEKDKLTSFSNYGEGVDLAARGYQVNAARAGGGYVRLSGTSMAAPFVAGAAGAILTKYPTAKYGEVIQRLKRVRRTNRLKDKVGWRGILNLAKGLR